MSEEAELNVYPEYRGHYQPDLPADKDLSSLNEAYQEGGYEAINEFLTPEQRAAYQEGGYEAINEFLSPEQRVAYQKGGDKAVNKLHSPHQAEIDNRTTYREALIAADTRLKLEKILNDFQPKPIHPGDEQEESEFDHYTGDKRVGSFLRERIEATDKRFQEQDQIENSFLNDIIPKISNFSELEDAQRLLETKVQNGLLRPDSVILVTQALNKKRESLQDKYYEEYYLNDQLIRLRKADRSVVLKNVYQEVRGLVAQDVRGGNIRAEQAIEFQQAFNDRISTLELSGK